jgi:ABC-type Fe3+ transport system permease subunit
MDMYVRHRHGTPLFLAGRPRVFRRTLIVVVAVVLITVALGISGARGRERRRFDIHLGVGA